jgi:glucose-1-phosphate thymidylyltransferase
LCEAAKLTEGALIFAYPVCNPQSYGVVEFDGNGCATSLEEMPEHPKSHFAIPDLYFCDQPVVEIAKTIYPTERGELEITDLNRVCLERGN